MDPTRRSTGLSDNRNILDVKATHAGLTIVTTFGTFHLDARPYQDCRYEHLCAIADALRPSEEGYVTDSQV